MTWILLVYTVPAEPSRKRASIWREVAMSSSSVVRLVVAPAP
jgi:hypothetical protein